MITVTGRLILWTLLVIILFNEIAAVITVFREKRDIAATWAWLLVLTLIPVFGFIAYAFLGRKPTRKRMARIQTATQLELRSAFEKQQKQFHEMEQPEKSTTRTYWRTVMLFQSIDHAYFTRHNHVDIYDGSDEFFNQLFKDIAAAKKSIHIEFYTIYNDQIGNELRTLLEEKAAQGVEVRVLYDSWGSRGVKPSFYNQLRENGGHAAQFLTTHSNLFDFRINYRDHRKIVVLDGKYGYVGGFNIGDQYLGRVAKFGPWRDTHLRILGGAVYSLQQRFIRDWNASMTKESERILHYQTYFPPITVHHGFTAMQIVDCGPDSRMEKIKLGYLRLINAATDHIWIQTPYLIPDDSILDALKIAAHSGVDVRIMIPCKPDHPFVYRASQYFARELANEGVTIYYYEQGFLHAKTVMVDGKMASVGSANMDYRSFKLNFEINSFIYDAATVDQLERIFMDDIRVCKVVTPEMFANQPLWLRFKQTFSRLLSPIL